MLKNKGKISEFEEEKIDEKNIYNDGDENN
jgi:hypothetical protein